MLAFSWTWLIPVYLIAGIVVVLGILAVLSRIQNGRYVRPLVTQLARIPWLRKQMTKASTAALERQNPELASAMRKVERHGKQIHTPQGQQKVMSQLTREERRALLEFQEQQQEQTGLGEVVNRQQRRNLERARRNAQRGGR
jgi:hypothetical protein